MSIEKRTELREGIRSYVGELKATATTPTDLSKLSDEQRSVLAIVEAKAKRIDANKTTPTVIGALPTPRTEPVDLSKLSFVFARSTSVGAVAAPSTPTTKK